MAEDYREVIGSAGKLRRGFTTGTAAAAAAKAAALMLLENRCSESVEVRLPKGGKIFSGKEISIPVHSCSSGVSESGKPFARASVLKDSGDDRDDTDGIEIIAEAVLCAGEGIELAAGEGIGTVTGDGLPVGPGQPAINPVPAGMIRSGIKPLLTGRSGGIRITFSAPEGRRIAAKTWNSRVGVEGGISIIGTSGVVEPSSEQAFRSTLGLVIKAAAAQRSSYIIAGGYVGERFLTQAGADKNCWVAVGDYVGFALEQAVKRGFKRILLPLHIGKLTKVAAGIFNTHCRYGDARLETLAAAAGACGASQQQVTRLLEIPLAEDAARLTDEWGLQAAFVFIAERAKNRCEQYCGGETVIETICLNLKAEALGWSGGLSDAEELCRSFM